MNEILEFLKSIDNGKIHPLRNQNAFDVFDGKNNEVMLILKLEKQGLVAINTDFINGKLTISGYYLTKNGKEYIQDHSKLHKIKKIF